LDAQGPRVTGRLTRQRFEFAGSGVGMAEAKAILRTLDAHGIGEVQTGGDGRRTFNSDKSRAGVQLPTLNSQ
jgi:hypothetical protein